MPPSRIVLAGKSQGGALALLTAYCCLRHKIAAVFTSAAYFPLVRPVWHAGGMGLLPPPQTGVNRGTPLLLAHGSRDSLVKPVVAELIAQMMRHHGVPVTLFHGGPIDHPEDPWPAPEHKAAISQ